MLPYWLGNSISAACTETNKFPLRTPAHTKHRMLACQESTIEIYSFPFLGGLQSLHSGLHCCCYLMFWIPCNTLHFTGSWTRMCVDESDFSCCSPTLSRVWRTNFLLKGLKFVIFTLMFARYSTGSSTLWLGYFRPLPESVAFRRHRILPGKDNAQHPVVPYEKNLRLQRLYSEVKAIALLVRFEKWHENTIRTYQKHLFIAVEFR